MNTVHKERSLTTIALQNLGKLQFPSYSILRKSDIFTTKVAHELIVLAHLGIQQELEEYMTALEVEAQLEEHLSHKAFDRTCQAFRMACLYLNLPQLQDYAGLVVATLGDKPTSDNINSEVVIVDEDLIDISHEELPAVDRFSDTSSVFLETDSVASDGSDCICTDAPSQAMSTLDLSNLIRMSLILTQRLTSLQRPLTVATTSWGSTQHAGFTQGVSLCL